MTFGIVTKAFLIWFGILVLAIANGTLREAILIPALGKAPAFFVSGILLSLLILAATYLSLPWLGSLQATEYIAIGLAWLFLTLAFEFTFGRLIQGKPWSQILDAYTFKDGDIWPVVLIVTAIAPYIAARLRDWL
jgi:hypothetical protein